MHCGADSSDLAVGGVLSHPRCRSGAERLRRAVGGGFRAVLWRVGRHDLAQPTPTPLVLSGHAASLTPY
jgi:hypothetical protein